MAGWHHRLDGHEFEEFRELVMDKDAPLRGLAVLGLTWRQAFTQCVKWQGSRSVAQSVVSDSLQPHGLQHARPPCPSPTPGVTHTHLH